MQPRPPGYTRENMLPDRSPVQPGHMLPWLRHTRPLRQELQQITDSPNTVNTAAYSGGVFVSFLSNGDLLGAGTNDFGLYLVNLFTLGAATGP